MKTKLFFSLAAATLVCASCSNEELENSLLESIGQKVTITATIEGEEGQTRSTVTDEGAFSWSEGDGIGVYTTKSAWKQFTYTSGNKFDGTLDQDEKTSTWAVYPFTSGEITGEEYTITLPAEYILGSNVNNTNAPMVAWFDEGETDFEFKHLGGVIRFTLTNVPSSATQFVLTADQKINGEFVFTQPSEDENYIIETESTDNESEKSTTLQFETATETMTFYVPLPTGTYNSMTFSLMDEENNVLFTRTSTKSKTVVRRSLLKMNPIEATVTVDDEEGLRAAIAAGGNVTLGNNITLTGSPIIIESGNTIINLNNHDLTAAIFQENGGEITEGSTDSYVFWVKGGTLTINGEGNVKAQKAKYSIAVWANGGKVVINGGSYSNSFASDLIYAKGQGSEISIYGGTFTASNEGATTEEGTAEGYSALNLRDNSGAKITVYGGKFYKFDPANNKSENPAISFVAPGYSSVAEGDYYVVSEGIKNEIALNAAIAASGTVKLGTNIDLTSAITITNAVTIDLNGHTIENKVAGSYSGLDDSGDECIVFAVLGSDANLTLNDSKGTGKVIATGDDEKSFFNVAVWVANGARATINGGEYTNSADPSGDGCDLIYGRNGANITVTGGTFKAGAPRATMSNIHAALNCKDESATIAQSTITVSGGKFYKFGATEAAQVGQGEVVLLEVGYEWSSTADANDYYTVTKTAE